VSQNAQPVPAQPAGTVVTQWGDLPAYTAGDKHNPLDLNPKDLPVPRADYYKADFDLLVERDGTVRDVFVRNPSGFPGVDKTAAAQFKEARSRLVLAPSDPAPYVIRYTLVRKTELTVSETLPPRYTNTDPGPRMGTGAPYWGKP
jgi:hypothetical protein